MKLLKDKFFHFAFFIVFFMLINITSVLAAENLRAAKVLDYSGQVTIKKVGGEKSFSVFKGMSLSQGDAVLTGKGAWVSIELDKETKVKIAEKSQVIISELIAKNKKEKTLFTLNSGKIWSNIKKKLNIGSKFEIKTPTAVMGVRGTKFYVSHEKGSDGGNTDVAVLEGSVTSTVNLGRSTKASQERKIEIVLDTNKQMSFNEQTLEALDNALSGNTAPTQEDIQAAAQEASGMQDVTPNNLDTFVLDAISEDPEGIEQGLLENINTQANMIDGASGGDSDSGDDDIPQDHYLVSIDNSILQINGSEIQSEAVIAEGSYSLRFNLKNKKGIGLWKKNIQVKGVSDTYNYQSEINGIKDVTINFQEGIYHIYFKNELKTVIYCVKANNGLLKLSGKVAHQEKPIKNIIINKDGEHFCDIQYLNGGPFLQSLSLPAGNYSLILFSVGENEILVEETSVLDFHINANVITNLTIE